MKAFVPRVFAVGSSRFLCADRHCSAVTVDGISSATALLQRSSAIMCLQTRFKQAMAARLAGPALVQQQQLGKQRRVVSGSTCQ
jgi:hypothetical protein